MFGGKFGNLRATATQQPKEINQFKALPALDDEGVKLIENMPAALKAVQRFQVGFKDRVNVWGQIIGVKTSSVGVCATKSVLYIPPPTHPLTHPHTVSLDVCSNIVTLSSHT